ncbi:hypothetical protein EJ07DRAFT_153647 [Lizonia empirigonia]|nr:hypothetical protein EJ07DRAFT_153647 [Lizonia empirigonia]
MWQTRAATGCAYSGYLSSGVSILRGTWSGYGHCMRKRTTPAPLLLVMLFGDWLLPSALVKSVGILPASCWHGYLQGWSSDDEDAARTRTRDDGMSLSKKQTQSNWNRSSRPRAGRGSASSRTQSRLVRAKYLWSCCCLASESFTAVPRQQPTSPRQASASERCCPAHLPAQRHHPLVRPRPPTQPQQPPTWVREQVTASARAARAFVIAPSREKRPLRLRARLPVRLATAALESSPCFRDTRAPAPSTRSRT